MGNVKLPISWKCPAVEQNGVKYGTRGLFRKYMQFLELWPVAKFHAKNMAILKQPRISETAARSENKLNFDTLG